MELVKTIETEYRVEGTMTLLEIIEGLRYLYINMFPNPKVTKIEKGIVVQSTLISKM